MKQNRNSASHSLPSINAVVSLGDTNDNLQDRKLYIDSINNAVNNSALLPLEV